MARRGSILDLFSERVGSEGLVVGLARETHFFAMACAEATRRGLSNVKITAGDALSPDLWGGSFDFCTRALGVDEMPDAQQRKMVAQMPVLLKPGGSIALQDYDGLLRALPGTFVLVDFARWATPSVPAVAMARPGVCCPCLLRSAGARNVKTKIHASFVDVGDGRRTHHLLWR